MINLAYLDGMDVNELEVVHDYLNRSKLPANSIFRKAAFDTLCITKNDADNMQQHSRKYLLIASIITLLLEREK